jgi:hypothetical protein
MEKEMDKVNKNRRNLLKIVLIGGGAVVATKILGPKVMDFFYGPPVTKDFKNFNVTETRTKFSISAKDGTEIFIMDNEKE